MKLYEKAFAYFHKMKTMNIPRNFRHYMIFFTFNQFPFVTYPQVISLIDSAYEDRCLDNPLMGAAIKYPLPLIHLRNLKRCITSLPSVTPRQVDVLLAKIQTFNVPMQTRLFNIILNLFVKRRNNKLYSLRNLRFRRVSALFRSLFPV
jgi:hypothetical protein